MSGINPKVYERNGQCAKEEAGKLAVAMGFRLKQSAKGKPELVLTTGGVRQFKTWLGAFSWLHACWLDRQPKEMAGRPAKAREPPFSRVAVDLDGNEIPIAKFA